MRRDLPWRWKGRPALAGSSCYFRSVSTGSNDELTTLEPIHGRTRHDPARQGVLLRLLWSNYSHYSTYKLHYIDAILPTGFLLERILLSIDVTDYNRQTVTGEYAFQPCRRWLHRTCDAAILSVSDDCNASR